jgi:hypothetical protein
VIYIPKKVAHYAAIALFGLCIAPTFISYMPYAYRWDDSDYLQRSITVSRAFWSGNLHQVVMGIHSNRLPVMMLLGLPWGPLTSWDAAGKCFISLATLLSLLACICLYLMLRIGIRPIALVIGSLCVFGSMGLGPLYTGSGAHRNATAFMADNLVAWTSLASLLLIPFEAKEKSLSMKSDILRGILWGSIFSLGVLSKVSFFYFVILILPILLIIRYRSRDIGSICVSLAALALCSVPAAVYWLRYGQLAWSQATTSSFGRTADFYYTPLLPFLHGVIRESPGVLLTLAFVVGALAYVIIKKRTLVEGPTLIALLICIGFGVITLASTDRLIRFSFPAIVSIPFIAAILISGREDSVSRRASVLPSIFIFCGLVIAATPMLHRPDRGCIARCNAVLAEAAKLNANRILLATDSATLNADLMRLAVAVSAWRDTAVVSSVNPLYGTSIEQDFQTMRECDLVVFQDERALYPPFTNERAPKYELFAKQLSAGEAFRVGEDVTVYEVNRTAQ